MAKKQPVDPGAIDLLGKKKDATLLARYAAENGAAALPLLEDAFAKGSPPMRAAAVSAIAKLDAAHAEELVAAALGALGKKGAAKQRKLLDGLLLSIASPSAIARFLEGGGSVKEGVQADIYDALVKFVASEAPRADVDRLQTLIERTAVLERWFDGDADPAARDLALVLLRHPSGAFRDAAADFLGRFDGPLALSALEQLGAPATVHFALKVSTYASPEKRFAALSRYAGSASDRKAVAGAIQSSDDPAWLRVLGPFIDEPEVFQALVRLRHPAALERLRATAARAAFDLETKTACYLLGAVGDQEASPILLRWLDDPVASEAAPLLLTALSQCGDARAVPVLEHLRSAHPARAGFFDHAIRSIRARCPDAIA
jgi:hypothetical protein